MVKTDIAMMERRVHIGLMGEHPGWEQLLGQIGVSWSHISHHELFGNNNTLSESPPFSLVVVTQLLDTREMQKFLEWIQGDVALIDTTGQFQDQMPLRAYIRTVQPEAIDEPFRLPVPLEVHQYCLTLAANATASGILRLQNERAVAFFGMDPVLTYLQPEMTWRRLHHSTLPTIAERLAKRPSHPLMLLVLQVLVLLHHRIGLPFVHLWWYSKPAAIPFTFRIDTDYAGDEVLRKLRKLLTSKGVAATWFLHSGVLDDLRFLSEWHEADGKSEKDGLDGLDGAGVESGIDEVRSFKNQELAFHCEDHLQYPDKIGYSTDIQRGLRRLQDAGNPPVCGYAAPYGTWTEHLREAIEEQVKQQPFLYSSEFGYDYDAYPSVPSGSSTLQLPVHPVSMGTLRRFGYSQDDQIEYYKEWIEARKRLHLPLHLYFHPGDAAPEELNTLLELITAGDTTESTEAFLPITYTQYAALWMKRAEVRKDLKILVRCAEGSGLKAGLNEHRAKSGESAVPDNQEAWSTGDNVWPLAVYPVPADSRDDLSFTVKYPPANREWFSVHHDPSSTPYTLCSRDDTTWFRHRSSNNTLSWFRFRKYQYLSWLWRKKG